MRGTSSLPHSLNSSFEVSEVEIENLNPPVSEKMPSQSQAHPLCEHAEGTDRGQPKNYIQQAGNHAKSALQGKQPTKQAADQTLAMKNFAAILEEGSRIESMASSLIVNQPGRPHPNYNNLPQDRSLDVEEDPSRRNESVSVDKSELTNPEGKKSGTRRGKKRQKDADCLESCFNRLEDLRKQLDKAEADDVPYQQRRTLRNRFSSLQSRIKHKVLHLEFFRQTTSKDQKMISLAEILERRLPPHKLAKIKDIAQQEWKRIDDEDYASLPLVVTSQGIELNGEIRPRVCTKRRKTNEESDFVEVTEEAAPEKAEEKPSTLSALVQQKFVTPQALLSYCQQNEEEDDS